MMRFVYVFLIYLLAPVVMAMEGWRALWNPDYRGQLRQRLGLVAPEQRPGCIWVHAVSVGEVQAASGLIRALHRRFPEHHVVVTTVTPTGAQRVRALFGDEVRHCYLPYDLPGSVARFLDRIQPRVAIIIETEIWPTLYRALGRRRIPLVLASARISQRSVGRYRQLASLFKETLSHGIVIGAQSAVDAERFRSIGASAERTQVTGNVKFDVGVPQSAIDAGLEFRAAHCAARPVWVAGSTHEGEEEQVLDAHAAVRAAHPQALLVLVPRHPPRFDGVHAWLARKRGLPGVARRSLGESPKPGDAVYLVDTLGELNAFYAAGDVAFVGGTLVPIGGHNLLEPAVLGKPVLSGPNTYNAQEVADQLVQAGAVRIVANADELGAQVARYFAEPELARADGAKGAAAVEQSRGAVDRLVKLVEPLLT
jgi:3-deoxy-D-manno-octulosonic-acid transferase